MSVDQLTDVFELPFDGEEDPRLQCARVLTRAEAEAILEYRGNLVDALSQEECCAGRYVLWMLHLRGPDDIYPALNYETAVEWADRANGIVPECRAIPAIWTGTRESHAANLPEAMSRMEKRPALATGAKA